MFTRTILPRLILVLAGAAWAAAGVAGPSDEQDAKIKELRQERLAALRQLVKVASAEYQSGKGSFERVQQAVQANLQAQLESCASDKDRKAILEEAVAAAKGYEKSTVQRYRSGLAPQSDVLLSTVARLEAEIALAKAQVAARPK